MFQDVGCMLTQVWQVHSVQYGVIHKLEMTRLESINIGTMLISYSYSMLIANVVEVTFKK